MVHPCRTAHAFPEKAEIKVDYPGNKDNRNDDGYRNRTNISIS
jgi:hypothetical protein